MKHAHEFYIDYDGEITIDLELKGDSGEEYIAVPADLAELVRIYVATHVTPQFIKQIENQILILDTDGKTVRKWLEEEKRRAILKQEEDGE